MNWQVVSFYTVNTGYEEEVKKLEVSLKEHGLDYHLFPCEPLGSWRKNLNYKSASILKAFDMFPDKDIVFIDADAIVRQHPALFDELSENHTHDMAAHFHPYMGTRIKGGSLLSGTLWFHNSDRGKALVAEWDRIARAHPTVRHQHCLRLAGNELNRGGMKLTVYRLPREYTQIFDYYKGDNRPNPVIEHFQKSRQLRKEVGYGRGLLNSSFATLAQKGRMERRAFVIKQTIARGKMLTTQDLKRARK